MKQEIMNDNASPNKPVTLWVRIPLFIFFAVPVFWWLLTAADGWNKMSEHKQSLFLDLYEFELGQNIDPEALTRTFSGEPFAFIEDEWLRGEICSAVDRVDDPELEQQKWALSAYFSRNNRQNINFVHSNIDKVIRAYAGEEKSIPEMYEEIGRLLRGEKDERDESADLIAENIECIAAGISLFFGLVWLCCNFKKTLFWIGKFAKNKVFWMVFISVLFYVAAIICVWSVPEYEHCFFLGIFGSLWCAIELQFLLLMKSIKKSSRLAKIYHLAALVAVPVFWWLLAAADVRTEDAIALFAPAPYCCVWVIFVLHVQIKKYLKA